MRPVRAGVLVESLQDLFDFFQLLDHPFGGIQFRFWHLSNLLL
jgi:hypothetical protein